MVNDMKKGFTLTELLAVIVVLAIVTAIAVPKIGQMISQAKESTYKIQLDNIVEAAKSWSNSHINDIPTNGSKLVLLEDLEDSGDLPGDIKNPATGESLSGICVLITDSNNLLSYQIYEGCTSAAVGTLIAY